MKIADSTLLTLQTPASVSATGYTAGVDARSLVQQGAVILTALKTSGTNPTLAIKLQGAPDGDVVTSVTKGSNTGTGTCTEVYGGPDAVAETITVTLTNATTATVVGGTSGSLANATVGTPYTSAAVCFLLTAGGTAFANNDTFSIVTTARTYADVEGGGFTSLTASPSVQKVNVNFDSAPRYLRLAYTIGGTNSPAYTVAAAAQAITL